MGAYILAIVFALTLFIRHELVESAPPAPKINNPYHAFVAAGS